MRLLRCDRPLTVPVVRALRTSLRPSLLPGWLAVIGLVAAALIATGVAVPLVHPASLTNFAGYLLWCGWLLTVAVTLFRFRPLGISSTQSHHWVTRAHPARP